MPKLPKITSLPVSLQRVKKDVSDAVDFYMQISMKAKLILRFFDGYGQAFPKSPKK